jgi:hypothetical protein
MLDTFPAVFVTLVDTQHRLPELSGSMICHQVPSPDFPVICELVPTFNPLSTIQPVPGPSRQLTATSFGDATGTLGVDVKVGGGGFVGNGVCVGIAVEGIGVNEGVLRAAVGVSVGILDGKLQASDAKTRARTDNKLRSFIACLL